MFLAHSKWTLQKKNEFCIHYVKIWVVNDSNCMSVVNWTCFETAIITLLFETSHSMQVRDTYCEKLLTVLHKMHLFRTNVFERMQNKVFGSAKTSFWMFWTTVIHQSKVAKCSHHSSSCNFSLQHLTHYVKFTKLLWNSHSYKSQHHKLLWQQNIESICLVPND